MKMTTIGDAARNSARVLSPNNPNTRLNTRLDGRYLDQEAIIGDDAKVDRRMIKDSMLSIEFPVTTSHYPFFGFEMDESVDRTKP